MAETAAIRDPKKRAPIERLLNPESVAIAGVSSTPGSLAGIVLDNLRRFGFAGALHLIHPTRDEVQGMPCFRNVRELPYGVDCVVLAIPAVGVVDVAEAVRPLDNHAAGPRNGRDFFLSDLPFG